MRASGTYERGQNTYSNPYNLWENANKDKLSNNRWANQLAYSGKDVGNTNAGEIATYLDSDIFHNKFRAAAGMRIDDKMSVQNVIAALRAEGKADRADTLQILVNDGFLSADAWINDYDFSSLTAMRAAHEQAGNRLMSGDGSYTARDSNISSAISAYDAEFGKQRDLRAQKYAEEKEAADRAAWEAKVQFRDPMEDMTEQLYQEDFNDSWGPRVDGFREILKDPNAASLYGVQLTQAMQKAVTEYDTYVKTIKDINTYNSDQVTAAAEKNSARNNILQATQDADNTSQSALAVYLKGTDATATNANRGTFNQFSGISQTAALQQASQQSAGLDAEKQSGVAIKNQEARTRMFDVLVKMAPEEQNNVLNSIGIELGDDIDANKTAVQGLLNNIENAIRDANLTASAEVDNVNNRLSEIKNILAGEQLDRANAMQMLMLLLGVASTVTSIATAGLK
jgi:hypothetical protein